MVFLLALAACGESRTVGSQVGVNSGKEGEASLRDQADKINQDPAAKGGGAGKLGADVVVTPPPTPTPGPTPPPSFYNVDLIANSPYYSANGAPVNQMQMRASSILKVTNRDNTQERRCRSFTHDPTGGNESQFSSGCLPPGADWEWRFDAVGSFRIKDEGLTFATASLRVVQ